MAQFILQCLKTILLACDIKASDDRVVPSFVFNQKHEQESPTDFPKLRSLGNKEIVVLHVHSKDNKIFTPSFSIQIALVQRSLKYK